MIAFGADIGLRRVSIAVVDSEAGLIGMETAIIPPIEEIGEAETVARLYNETARRALWLRLDHGEPSVCIVERPGGKFVSAEMHYSFAIVTAALENFAGGMTTYLAPSSWKSRALGKGFGHASKAEVMEWAKRNGYEGVNQDEADALGIATAGLAVVSTPTPAEQLPLSAPTKEKA